jgi:hypothetical protein
MGLTSCQQRHPKVLFLSGVRGVRFLLSQFSIAAPFKSAVKWLVTIPVILFKYLTWLFLGYSCLINRRPIDLIFKECSALINWSITDWLFKRYSCLITWSYR